MRILLTNDDGYESVFLKRFFKYCVEKLPMHTFEVMAPRKDNSGISQAITMTGKIFYERIDASWYVVDGTPTDCVVVGLNKYPDIDMVIAGPNAGSNLGQDIIYSGTVGAAREAAIQDIPALAFSIMNEETNPLSDFREERFCAFLDRWLVPFMHLAREEKSRIINVNISKLDTFEVAEADVSHRYYCSFNERMYKNENMFLAEQAHLGVDDTRAPDGSDWKISLEGKTVYTVVEAWPTTAKNTISRLERYSRDTI